LKAADTRNCSGWCPNFRGKIRQGGDVIARQRGLGGELHPRQLHAITGISGKSDYDAVAMFAALADRTTAEA